jgi:signal transduction histidine kinase
MHLALIMLLITLPVIGLVAVLDYQQVEKELIAGEDLLREQTEKSVIQSLTLMDAGLSLFDSTLDHRMQEGFGRVLAGYEQAEGDPGAMDLSRLREDLGGEMDIYVINASGVIEYTTYPPDLGLDFRKIPGFYDRITEIRLGDAFVADRVVAEPAGGMLRKYAYMPSPDHRYLFELGLVCTGFEADRYDPHYQGLRDDLMRLNPSLLGVRLFDCYGRPINVTESEMPVGDTVNPVALEVFEAKESRTLANPDSRTIARYLFVDLSDPGHPSDTSRVVELTYTTAPLGAQLAEMRFGHALIVILASLVACCIAIPVSRRVTRPVREIVDDVNRIAHGDLDHRIRGATGAEFTRLEKSIGAMVDSLKENIRRLRDSEETSRQYSTRLEEQVRSRTAELEESNQAAALFLDIMVHDINNANTIAIGYTQVLIDALEGEQQEMAKKMLARFEQSSGIIANVATLRRVRETEAALVRVDLDAVIRAQVADHPAARYDNRPVAVLADGLLSDVFVNLIGNAAKFGGPEVGIAIRVEEREDDVVVFVEDDGPGIPDDLKPRLFGRLSRGDHRAAGTGLGLYICRMLIERYGGTIRAEDRVEGRPEEGTAIRFTLRKAPEE